MVGCKYLSLIPKRCLISLLLPYHLTYHGEEKSPGHFVECREARTKLPSSLRPGKEREEMLGHKGHTKFLAYLEAGSPYGSGQREE